MDELKMLIQDIAERMYQEGINNFNIDVYEKYNPREDEGKYTYSYNINGGERRYRNRSSRPATYE